MFEVRRLEAVLDDEPLLGEPLMELAEWIAQYYIAPLGEVLRAMLPLMAEVRRTVYYRITDLGRDMLASAMESDAGSANLRPLRTDRGRMPFAAGRARDEGREQSSHAEEQDVSCECLRAFSGRAGEGFHAAHGYGGLTAGACLAAAQKVDRPRNSCRRARCAAHGALCGADS